MPTTRTWPSISGCITRAAHDEPRGLGCGALALVLVGPVVPAEKKADALPLAKVGRSAPRSFAYSNTVYSVALSPDGKVLVAGGFERPIQVWDATTGEALRHLDG